MQCSGINLEEIEEINNAEWFEWTVQVIIPVIDNFLLEKIEGYMLG